MLLEDEQTKTDIMFVPFTQNWVNSVWNLIKDDTESIPKSWPKTLDQLSAWSLGTRKQQTISDRSLIISKSEEDGEYLPIGIITGDLVRGANKDNFPGAQYGDVNIAYMIFKPFRGFGHAQNALMQISQSWKQDGKKPMLRISSDNLASRKVALNSGFKLFEAVQDNGRILYIFK
ncbi:MAG: GNAT family N-acetyltransferase [Acidimicrobiia bacterium]